MTKDYTQYALHIVESINLIEAFVNECTSADLSDDRKTYDAILRNLQTMGESTKRLPEHLKEKYDRIKWRGIAGFRNILVHDYLGNIDEKIVRVIIKNDLGPLKEAMLEILEEHKSSQ